MCHSVNMHFSWKRLRPCCYQI